MPFEKCGQSAFSLMKVKRQRLRNRLVGIEEIHREVKGNRERKSAMKETVVMGSLCRPSPTEHAPNARSTQT